jgi:xanthine dehydrogenase accessory factor
MDIYEQLSKLRNAGKPVVLCIITKTSGSTPRRAGTKMLVYPDGSISGTIGGGKLESKVIKEALKSLKAGKPILISYSLSDPDKGDPGVCGGQMEVYVEPILKQETLIVIGAGHVGKALAQLGSWLGFKVVLADDRSGYANKENAPDVDSFIEGSLDEIIESLNIHENSKLVLTTRNLDIDVEILPHILACNPKYIGVIG